MHVRVNRVHMVVKIQQQCVSFPFRLLAHQHDMDHLRSLLAPSDNNDSIQIKYRAATSHEETAQEAFLSTEPSLPTKTSN